MAYIKAGDQRGIDCAREWTEALQRTGLYHSLELPDGTVLEGLMKLDHQKKRLARFPLPANLPGKRVLDIGCWDGWFSFEMERRGAEVMAIDIIEREKFRMAHKLWNSKIDFRVLDIDELTPATAGRFDIILFFGVLYHLRHPLLSLERVCQLTRDMALVESFVIDDRLEPGRAILEFYETNELQGQMDNWYGPNTACLLALCRAAGFARVELGDVCDQRAPVTCYRHWEPVPAHPAQPPPEIVSVVNNRSCKTEFHKRKDEYASCYFKSIVPGLRPLDVKIEIDGYGYPALSVTPQGGDGWQADIRFPQGLDPGQHAVRMRLEGSDYGNSVSVEVQPALTGEWL